MGSPKALLDIDGRPLLARLVETIHGVGRIDPVLIVTGHDPTPIRDAIGDGSLVFVHNPIYETGGMLSSIKAGIRELPPQVGAFFVMLLDQPLVQAATLAAMIERWQHRHPVMVTPAHQGKHGHPILISAGGGGEILSLPDDATLREFVTQHRETMDVVEVSDPGILSDVDTPADYQLLLRLWRTITCPTGNTSKKQPVA